MREHIHTGFVEFVFVGVSAIVFLHITRFAAAQLVDKPSTAALGKMLGSLVNFGAPTAS